MNMKEQPFERSHAMSIYNKVVLEHFRAPQNVGGLEEQRVDVGTGRAGGASHGCIVRFQLVFGMGGVVEQARYRVFGCPFAIAACSRASEVVRGCRVEALDSLGLWPLLQDLQPPAEKRGIVLVIEDAIRAAAGDYQAKKRTAGILPSVEG